MDPLITLDQLLRICPNAMERLPRFVQPLDEGMREFEIDRPNRMAMFLANLAHESGEFQWMREIWGPTEAQRLYERDQSAPWPTDALEAKLSKFDRNRKAWGLGNTEPGDGRRFAGHGPIQITGRANHRACSIALYGDEKVLLDNPERLEWPKDGVRAACWFWDSRDLNTLADAGDFRAVVKKINGGYNGFTFRQMYYERALNAL